MKLENKSACVYETKNPFEKGCTTEIKGKEEFRGYASQIFSIADIKFKVADLNSDIGLTFSLEGRYGSQIPYFIAGRYFAEQFISDVMNYGIEDSHPESFWNLKNMKGKLVEVFLTGGSVKGVSPVYNMHGNNPHDWGIADYVTEDPFVDRDPEGKEVPKKEESN